MGPDGEREVEMDDDWAKRGNGGPIRAAGRQAGGAERSQEGQRGAKRGKNEQRGGKRGSE